MSAPRSLRLTALAAAAALVASCDPNADYIWLTTPPSICVAPGETVSHIWQARVVGLRSARATVEVEGTSESFTLQPFTPIDLPVHENGESTNLEFTLTITGIKVVDPLETLALAVRGDAPDGRQGRSNLVKVKVSEACRTRPDAAVPLPPPADAAVPARPDVGPDAVAGLDGGPTPDLGATADGPAPDASAPDAAAPDLAPAADAGVDRAADLPPTPDSAPDTAPMPDAAPDAAAPDTQPDAAPDLAPDLAADSAPDVAPDLASDMMVVLPPGADLAVTLSQMSTASAPLHPGDKVTITALVRNNGPEAAMFSWVDLTWPGTRFSRDTTVNAQGVTLPPGAQIFSQSSTLDEISFNSIAVGATYEVKWHFVVQALASPETAMTSAVVAASGPADMVQPNNQSALSTSLAP